MIKVALVSGGYSKEDVISFDSAHQIAKSIDKSQFIVYQVLINKEKWVYIDKDNTEFPIDKNDFSTTVNGEKNLFDIVFITIHGTPGEDGKLQGYFDMLNIPYTTSGAFTSALTFNKIATKRYLQQIGIQTAPSVFLRKGDEYVISDIVLELGLPLFVKPNAGGSSFGVSKVKKIDELQSSIDKAFAEDCEILIESFIEGTEVTCGLIKTTDAEYVFPATEIVSKNEFFDFEAKYTKGMADEITPARISGDEMASIQNLSSMIYDLLDCRGIVRVDYLIKQNSIYLIEINTVPGMSEASIVPQQAEVYGITTTGLFTLALNDALFRFRNQ